MKWVFPLNKNIKYIFGLLFFIYFLFYFFSLTFSKTPVISPSKKIIVALVSPFQSVVTSLGNAVGGTWSSYVWLINARKENETLKAEVQLLKKANLKLIEYERENERLKKIMDFKTPLPEVEIYAERIAFGSSSFEKTIRINKGKSDGIVSGMPVFNGDGVVGQVVDSLNHYSDVLLLIDKSSAIDVIVARSRVQGVLRGFTENQLQLEFVSSGSDILVGDEVLSSGLDGVYPSGVMIGKIKTLKNDNQRLFLVATVEPSVHFNRLEDVKVLKINTLGTAP